MKDQVPTVSPSSALSSQSVDRSLTPPSPPPAQPPPDPPASLPPSKTVIIQTGQLRCGICFPWRHDKHSEQTMNYLNECWEEHMERARAKKQEFSDMPDKITEDGEEETTGSTSSTSLSIFAEPLSPWLPPHTAIPPNACCILCTRDLSKLADLEALQHRVMCVIEQKPLCCSICSGSFTVEKHGNSVFRDPQYTLKHLHACQNDSATDDAATQAFEDLMEAWKGRKSMLDLFIQDHRGEKATWSNSDRVQEYIKKREAGREQGGFAYETGVTRLRSRVKILSPRDLMVGAELEVVVWEKESMPKGVPFDRFKRSAFHILAPNGMAKVPWNFKETKVVKKTFGLFDSRAFWAKLGLNEAPASPSLCSDLAELRAGSVAGEDGSPLIEGAAAEKFPVIGEEMSESHQSKPEPLRHSPGIMHPTTPMGGFDALLKKDTPRPLPTIKPAIELSESQKEIIDVFSAVKQRVDQSLPATTPTLENSTESTGVTLTRPPKRFPRLAFTNPPDAPSDAGRNTHSLQLHGRINTNSDSPLLLPPLNLAPRTGLTRRTTHRQLSHRNMSTTPIRLPPNVDSAVKMPQRESLQNTTPLMLPSPYAHALFFHDGSIMIFGDGVVPPSPNKVQDASSSEAEEDEGEVKAPATSPSPYDDKKGVEDEKTQDQTSEPSLILPASFPRTHHPALCPSIFLNPSEIDENLHTETYEYPGRGAIPTSLRSNLRTVVDLRLSAAEQAARNRQCCVLNFGSVGAGVQMLSEEEEAGAAEDDGQE